MNTLTDSSPPFRQQGRGVDDVSVLKKAHPSRRTIITAGAWTAPVFVASTAVPALAVSEIMTIAITPPASTQSANSTFAPFNSVVTNAAPGTTVTWTLPAVGRYLFDNGTVSIVLRPGIAPTIRSTRTTGETIVVTAAITGSSPRIAAQATLTVKASAPLLPPGIRINSGGGPWHDGASYDGWIAEGVSVTVADENGQPLVGVRVALAFGTGWKVNNFWFVQNPNMDAKTARQSANQHQSISLVTDQNGTLRLNTGRSGYLRKGSNGESKGVYLIAMVSGKTQQVLLMNSSAGGGKNPGIEP